MLHFAENMKKLRKQSGVTQERLAEIFGVTPGAVYKWESGASIPDVEVIVFLAEFFDTSVDSLLGYSLRHRSAKKAIAYLTELYIQKNESLLLTELERVLEKYPNSFYVVYQCAHLRLSLAMLNDDKSSYRKAYCLLERALELITQNDNPQIGEQTIRRNMASILLSLDKTEEAVGLLKRHNTDGISNSIIGFTLSRHGNPNEALTYLSKAFLTSLADSIQIFAGYANAYDRLDRPQDAIMALDWQTEALRGLRASDKPTYLDKLEAYMMASAASLHSDCGEQKQAREKLRQARILMHRFEENPIYVMVGIRFFHGDADIYMPLTILATPVRTFCIPF